MRTTPSYRQALTTAKMNRVTSPTDDVFLQWCGAVNSPVILDVRLNVAALQNGLTLAQQQFTEATFPGYRRSNNFSWTVRRLMATNIGYAQSGLLSWFCEALNSTPVV